MILVNISAILAVLVCCVSTSLGQQIGLVQQPFRFQNGGLMGGSMVPMSTIFNRPATRQMVRTGVVDQHIDPPFTHGNNQGVPAVHTTRVVGDHVQTRQGLGKVLGPGIGLGHAPGVVDQHVDPPFTHGNNRGVPALHTTSVVGNHGAGGHLGGQFVGSGIGRTIGLRQAGVVDQHVDPPFTHGNNRPTHALHTTSVDGGHVGGQLLGHAVGSGAGVGVGFGPNVGLRQTGIIDQHIDPPFTHGNNRPTHAVHTTKVDGGHAVGHLGGQFVGPVAGSGLGLRHAPGVVDQHIDPPFTHGNNRATPALHTTSVVGGHGGVQVLGPAIVPGAGFGLGTRRHVSSSVVDQHVDPPFTHGNNNPVPALHTTSVDHGHGPEVVDQHVDPPFTHGNNSPNPAVHTTSVDHASDHAVGPWAGRGGGRGWGMRQPGVIIGGPRPGRGGIMDMIGGMLTAALGQLALG